MPNGKQSSELKIGGIAFLAGIIATLVAAYAVVVRKRSLSNGIRPEFGGYDEAIGI